ncbi:LYAR-type C2HC zinc finger-domain-containing protein [Fimicolochytrium jonesii]|uniref:LYAR-type C2HC zinc finger-domain-containing protein n=1 Tax=Fimicolochytrium jonesii TaxID=1396493 RepID=UPI0022FEF86A|nr:LYAR-type C2HC zinc finger-domain-containing protein [Fimicolochytrium jonesii]KAI8820823.1 LYAR-type C2HC zinc finger-domain-containing protein [Fimicolochytrium jonesii]
MVSFVCDSCQETLKKAKLDQHTYRCHYAQFTCIDCSTTFQGTDYKAHTSCISEAEKYQGALYKGPKKGANKQQNNNNKQAKAASTPTPTPDSKSNIAKAPASLSLIDQIKNAEAAAATSTGTTITTTVVTEEVTKTEKRPREAEEGEEKKEKKEKKKSKKAKIVEKEVDVAVKVDEVVVEAGSGVDAAVDFAGAIKKVLKKTSELSIAELRKKTIKRISKKVSVTEEELNSQFDSLIKVALDGESLTLKL